MRYLTNFTSTSLFLALVCPACGCQWGNNSRRAGERCGDHNWDRTCRGVLVKSTGFFTGVRA